MKTSLLVSTFLAALSLSASASTIKIAFHNGGVTVSGFDSRPDGAVFATSNDTVNNIQNNGGSGLSFNNIALSLEDGTGTSATISGVSGFSNFNNNGWGGGTDDAVIMEGWYGFVGTESLTLSGLGTALGGSAYNITIYGDAGGSRVMDYTIGSTTKTINDVGNYPGGTSPALVEGANFITFDNLTGDGAIEILGNASGSRSAVNGIVITAVPEPSSFALLGLAGLALVSRRRR